MAKKLRGEVVIVLRTPVDDKENIAFRVTMRPQQMTDAVAKPSYGEELFDAFIAKACEIQDLELWSCGAQIIFPDADSIREARKDDVPSDLLRARTGMCTADLADGMYLLH